jgi:hypothetical protein
MDAHTSNGDAEHPEILSFRFHSSLLESHDLEEIVLPTEPFDDDEDKPLELPREGQLVGKNGEVLDQISIRMETVGRTHVFTKGRSAGAWGYSGSTKTSQRAFLQPANTKELKDLGSKARARKEEERMKRPEIQVLESVSVDPQKKRSKTSSFLTKTVKPTTARPARKRKSNSDPTPREASNKKSQRRTTSEIWFPGISHISVPPKDARSMVVRLHGLPVGCTMDHVKKFFTGLQPERIVMLLMNRARISVLDASNNQASSATKQRYASNFRVFAKFGSGPAAALASERSGETITTLNGKIFAIGVTQVRKDMATALSPLVSMANRPPEWYPIICRFILFLSYTGRCVVVTVRHITCLSQYKPFLVWRFTPRYRKWNVS